MDPQRFDALVRSLGAGRTRRRLLGLLGALPLLGSLPLLDDANAATRRRRQRKPNRNRAPHRDRSRAESATPAATSCARKCKTKNSGRARRRCRKRCQVPSPECTTSAECPTGQLCEDGLCIPIPDQCRVDPDCDACERCEAGVCAARCEPDQVCRDNVCEDVECRVDGDCTGCSGCVEGRCRWRCTPTERCLTDRCCQPRTCPSDLDCGAVDDRCGQRARCGPENCPGPGATCGGAGEPNVCGCIPEDPCGPGRCGDITNNCGEVITCEGCSGLNTCGGGNPGTPNVCGCTAVDPCGPKSCGEIANNCDVLIDCGVCDGLETCGGGNPGAENVCGCTRQCAGKQCGDDGCGSTCGSCDSNQECCSGACKLPTGGDCAAGGDDACCSGLCIAGECAAACSDENDPCDSAADCCSGTSCVNRGAGLGVCCTSGNACGTTCCADAAQICDTSGACCTQDDLATTCAGRCGTVTDTCGQRIDCGQPCAGGPAACCATFCRDLDSDLNNCGRCAVTCLDGTRGSPACCDGHCADLVNDPLHCGACGTACLGTTRDCCLSDCVDLRTDVMHCGACARVCTPEAVAHATAVACQAGACVATACEAGFTVVSGACCPNADLCGTAANLSCCGTGQRCCSDTCVDLSLDPDHCGACGRECPENISCAGGACGQGSFGGFCGGGISCTYTNLCGDEEGFGRDSCVNGQCCVPGGVSCFKETGNVTITFFGPCCCNPALSCPDVGTCPNVPRS